MIQAQVVEVFLNKAPGAVRALTSDSQRLLSYGICIGRWVGKKIILPGSGVERSRTVLRHRNLLVVMASSRKIPMEYKLSPG